MPQLLLRSYAGTLLDRSCRASVRRQMEYGRERGVPWGISESAYALTDRLGNYQYKAFGVPGLGLKRGLADDLVVAPYATALAGLIDPAAAVSNFVELTRRGLDGRFGFYESIDCRPRRPAVDAGEPPRPAQPEVVQAFFAHHQGMSLVAIANMLLDDVFVTRFHADPSVKATELLLQERVPREAILSEVRPAEGAPAADERRPRPVAAFSDASHHAALIRISCQTADIRPRSRTPAAARAAGGASRSRVAATTAPRTRARTSCTSAIRGRVRSGRRPTSPPVGRPTSTRPSLSSTKRPSGDATATSKRSFRSSCPRKTTWRFAGCRLPIAATGRARSKSRAMPRLCSRLPRTISLIPRSPSCSSRPSTTSRARVCCSAGVRRSAEESEAWAFHVLAIDGRLGGAVEWETDRARFIGRGRSPARPAALDGRALSGTTGAVLDPVAAVRERVRLAPGAFVRVTFSTGVAEDRAIGPGARAQVP